VLFLNKSVSTKEAIMSNIRITEAQKNKAIEVYAEVGTVLKASQAVGVSRQTIYEEMKRDKTFKKLMVDAKQAYVESLEDVLDRRIKDKNDKASAILLMFKLKKENHEYRDKSEYKVDAEIKIISGVPRPQ